MLAPVSLSLLGGFRAEQNGEPIAAFESNMVASVDLLIWRFNRAEVVPEYASLFLNSPIGLAQSERFQTGSSGQLHLYPQHVLAF
ncbi:MAG: hypothetical protein ABIV47_18630 [Roseiflexaceae bacterium]